MVKIYITGMLVLLFGFNCFAQETVERSRKLTPEVNEKYNVLKNDYNFMQGQYAAYLKKVLLAAGRYDKNKKVGTWTYFNTQGQLTQRYNYDSRTLTYEAPEDAKTGIRYIVDDSLKNNPRFTRPVRIGGRYFGYLPYINLVKLPNEFAGLSNIDTRVSMELLVTPLGRLAEFKLRIGSRLVEPGDRDAVFNINLNLLAEEDKVFIPATLNDEPIALRIFIPCEFYKGDLVRLAQ